ncbi:hypothetical protein ACFWBX_20135 [Streptomyces sp. NPDC059991]|uniref:hypothetical protein n=1 Tax=Streptomyces sp. NPDC059991 TaxID=3347028 RepID=UPI00369FACD9
MRSVRGESAPRIAGVATRNAPSALMATREIRRMRECLMMTGKRTAATGVVTASSGPSRIVTWVSASNDAASGWSQNSVES